MPTRILETGNRGSKGFTLLEVLGIIVLLGLATMLVFPNFTTSQEKIKLQYIGKLIKTDLQQVHEEVISEKTEQTVAFNGAGYSYQIGSRTITRSLDGFDFAFDPDAMGWEELECITQDAQVKFLSDGSCEEITIKWTSKNFQGSLAVKPDGTVSWNYEKRKAK